MRHWSRFSRASVGSLSSEILGWEHNPALGLDATLKLVLL